MRHLPVIPAAGDALDAVEIPIPCEVPWDAMTGNEQVRHCGECRQNVYNVAAFTRAEALQLLSSRAGRVCLRIYRRVDGTVVTSDCRERLRAARKRGWLVFAGALLIVAWAQICAQVVGLVGLRRLVGRGLMGSPPVSTLPARGVPGVPAWPLTGVPPLPPTTGEAPRVGEPKGEPTMGEKGPDLKGHIRVRTMGRRAAR
jgi:hypothetical protein